MVPLHVSWTDTRTATFFGPDSILRLFHEIVSINIEISSSRPSDINECVSANTDDATNPRSVTYNASGMLRRGHESPVDSHLS